MTSRAALLPYPGDPFLLKYWLSLYDKYWKNEVDHLYICLNSTIEKTVVDYIKQITDRPDITLDYIDHLNDHGPTIKRLLELCKETHVLLLEDDGFIFKSGLVDRYFKYIEDGDVDIVGSKRGSCHSEILDRAKEIWGLTNDGEGDQGPNFWPNFFFCRKEILMQTDQNFAAKAWYQGETIPALQDYKVQSEIIYGDTFVNTSLQLRSMVPISRILCVPQYHGSPDDLEHFAARYQHSMFNNIAGWCHIGSLSSGVDGVLRDKEGRPLSRRTIDPAGNQKNFPDFCNTDQERMEWERRAQWWLTVVEFAGQDIDKYPEMLEFYNAYLEAVDQLIQKYRLGIKNIKRRQQIYSTLGL